MLKNKDQKQLIEVASKLDARSFLDVLTKIKQSFFDNLYNASFDDIEGAKVRDLKGNILKFKYAPELLAYFESLDSRIILIRSHHNRIPTFACTISDAHSDCHAAREVRHHALQEQKTLHLLHVAHSPHRQHFLHFLLETISLALSCHSSVQPY